MNITGLLKAHGFRYDSTCYCDGTKAEKYKRGDWKIIWRKRAFSFRVKHYNQAVTKWIAIAKLETFLNELPKENISQASAVAR